MDAQIWQQFCTGQRCRVRPRCERQVLMVRKSYTSGHRCALDRPSPQPFHWRVCSGTTARPPHSTRRRSPCLPSHLPLCILLALVSTSGHSRKRRRPCRMCRLLHGWSLFRSHDELSDGALESLKPCVEVSNMTPFVPLPLPPRSSPLSTRVN